MDGFEAMSVAEQEAYLNNLASHSTDWFDELFRNSFEMNHHLSLSVVTKNTRIIFLWDTLPKRFGA
ncbi:MAG: hypothetical protein ACLU4N_04800 [Butyricimonas faecihominis]